MPSNTRSSMNNTLKNLLGDLSLNNVIGSTFDLRKIVHNNYVVKLISTNEKFPNVHKEQHTVVTECNS